MAKEIEWTPCTFCDFVSPSKAGLLKHICMYNPEYMLVEDKLLKDSQDFLTTRTDLIHKLFECEMCTQSFPSYKRFHEHHVQNCLASKWKEIKEHHQLFLNSETYR